MVGVPSCSWVGLITALYGYSRSISISDLCNAFSYQNANKGVQVHRPKSLVEVNQAITRLISIESQPKKVVVVVVVVVVVLFIIGQKT